MDAEQKQDLIVCYSLCCFFLLQAQCSGVSRMVGQKGKRNLLGKGPSTPEFLRGRMGHCLTDLSVWVPLQAHFDRRFRFNER